MTVAPRSPHANNCFWNMTDVIFFYPQLALSTVPPAQPCAHPCSWPQHPSTEVSLCGSPSQQHPQGIWDQPQLCGHQHSPPAYLSQWDTPIPASPVWLLSPSDTAMAGLGASETFRA